MKRDAGFIFCKNISCIVLPNLYPKLSTVYFFALDVFITAENMSSIHIKQ